MRFPRRSRFLALFSRMSAGTPALSGIVDTNSADNRVLENAAAGATVGITAYAFHIGYTVSYSLTDDASGQFAINSSTGVVTVADTLSAGAQSITVQAASSDGVSTTTRVFSVLVTEPPAISAVTDANGAANTVAEDAANGSTVGVTALATHEGYSITYSLTDDAGGRFAIHSSTGVVTKAGALDYGTATSHQITVQAASSDGVSTATEDFTISVTEAGAPPVDGPMLDFSKASNSMYYPFFLR